MHWLLLNNPAGQTNDRDQKLKGNCVLLLLHVIELKALTMVEKGEKQKSKPEFYELLTRARLLNQRGNSTNRLLNNFLEWVWISLPFL